MNKILFFLIMIFCVSTNAYPLDQHISCEDRCDENGTIEVVIEIDQTDRQDDAKNHTVKEKVFERNRISGRDNKILTIAFLVPSLFLLAASVFR